MQNEHIDTRDLTLVLERMNEFLSTDKLDEWEKRAVEVSPDTIFDNHPDNNFADYETLSVTELIQLKAAYEKLPSAIISLVDSTLSVGLSNLYGGTGLYSEHSLLPTMEVIDLMKRNEYAIPSLEAFTRFTYADNNGWGFPENHNLVR